MTEVAPIHGRRLDARFVLLEKLGSGGQGEVWRAHDETRGIDVALKVLTPAAARSETAWAAFEREYAIAARLDHPSVLKVFPPQRSGEIVVLPMELAPGGDLRRLRGAGYLEIIPVLLDIAQALEHAHERGVIHRDLKPGNVLFDARGRVKLADFGAASTTTTTAANARLQGLSPFTASPGQLRGEAPTEGDDIYGLGALAYELLSGYPPYYPHFDARRAQEEPVPDLVPTRQIPPLLTALVMRMLAKDPSQRPRSMREVIDELETALNDTLTFDFESITASLQPVEGTPNAVGAAAVEAVSTPAPPLTSQIRAPHAQAAQPQSQPLQPAAPQVTVTPAPAAQRQAPTPTPQMQRAPLAAVGLAAGGGPSIASEPPLWETLKLDNVPRVTRLEPIRRRHWPVVLLGVLAAVAIAVFYWLPHYAPQSLPLDLSALSRVTKDLSPGPSAVPSDTAVAGETSADSSGEAKLQAMRENFDRRLAALEARGAGVWGGAEFAMAKTRAAESVGAHDAGNTRMAQDKLADASRLLDEVDSRAQQALAAELATGQKALAAGQEELANQAFDLARRIDPNDRRIAEGQRHTRNLNGVLPLLADAQSAEAAHNYPRAAQDYSQALSLDPGNEKARSGLARTNAAFGDDNYAQDVGSGFAALGAGRLDDARNAFEKARTLRPNGAEAAEGLRRVGAALSAKGFASLRQRAAGLEAQERWDEAVEAYNSALQEDPSLAFAQEGKDRAATRAQLGADMQALIGRPERLSSQSIREQARALLQTANEQSPSGPVLRSQIARLELLLPDYDHSSVRSDSSWRSDMDKPVRLSLVSDNATAVAIPSIGQFGTFAKRDIELKPGRYTVIGTRDGYRDVHRDITIAPGQESQTISVSCSDPI